MSDDHNGPEQTFRDTERNLRDHIAALEARNARLEEQVREAQEDTARLDWLQSEYYDVRFVAGHGTEMCSPSDEVGILIVSHHMAKPKERVEAENWNENLRAAIDEARQALTTEQTNG